MSSFITTPLRERARARHARQLRQTLVAKLAPNRRCAICAERFHVRLLTVDHIDGCTYDRRALNAWQRADRYWSEFLAGVRLRALCNPCSGRDGATRWQGKPRYERAISRIAS